MQQITFQLGANETKTFDLAGRYFEIIDSAGPITVAFYDKNGSRTKELELGNVLSGTYVSDPFQRFEVSNPYGISQSITVMYGAGNGGTRRSPGVVSVIDGEYQKVLSGACFRGVCSQAGGGVGGAVGQLMNPIAALKNVFVQAIRLGSTGADSWNLFSTSTLSPILVGAGLNLDRNLSSAGASTRTGNDATAYASSFTYAIGYCSANTDLVLSFPRPVMLRPGFGLCVQINTLANNLRTTFEWEERA